MPNFTRLLGPATRKRFSRLCMHSLAIAGLASFTCKDFSTRRLQTITQEDIDHRLAKLQTISNWDILPHQ